MYKAIMVSLAIVLPFLLIAAYKETHEVCRDGVCKLPKEWREADRKERAANSRLPFKIVKVR